MATFPLVCRTISFFLKANAAIYGTTVHIAEERLKHVNIRRLLGTYSDPASVEKVMPQWDGTPIWILLEVCNTASHPQACVPWSVPFLETSGGCISINVKSPSNASVVRSLILPSIISLIGHAIMDHTFQSRMVLGAREIQFVSRPQFGLMSINQYRSRQDIVAFAPWGLGAGTGNMLQAIKRVAEAKEKVLASLQCVPRFSLAISISFMCYFEVFRVGEWSIDELL